MIQPFETKETLDSSYIYNSLNSKKNKIWPKILILLSVIFILLFINAIIIIYISIKEFEQSKIEINCSYFITKPPIYINLLSKEFENATNINIKIEDKLVEYSINHKLNKNGPNNVTFIVNNKLKMENMFKNITNLENVNILNKGNSSFDSSLSKAFYNCTYLREFYTNINPGNMKNLSYMFANCSKLRKVTFENFGGSAQDLSHMFENCINLASIELNNLNTSNVQNMSFMFFNSNLTEKNFIEKLNTSKVQNMSYMFSYCNNILSLNLYNFETKSVIDMSHMFENCESLTSLNLSNFYTNLVKDSSYMFSNCQKIEQIDISSFNACQIEDMSYMFYNCSNLTEIDINNDSFTPNDNTNITGMFENCKKEIIPDWYRDINN